MNHRSRELESLRALHREVWGAGYYDAYYARSAAAPRATLRARFIGIPAIVLGVALVMFGVFPTAAEATRPNPLHKVTLCHRTASYSNPYVVITVDVASILRRGHDTHNGPVFFPTIPKHQAWGDIIPPFNFGPGETYGGKNWDSAGMAVFNNRCTMPHPPATTTSTTHPTTTTTVPVSSTTLASSTTTLTSSSTTTTSTTGPSTTSSTTPSSSSSSTSVASSTTTVPGTVTTAGGSSTTIARETTSTAPGTVDTLGGPAPTPTTAANPRGALPRTGAATDALIGSGLSLILAGIGLTRRRRVRT